MNLNNKLDSFIDSFVVKMNIPVKSTSKSFVNNHIQAKSLESVTGKTKRKKGSLTNKDEISSICSSDNFGHKDDDELFFFDVSGNDLTQPSVVHNKLKEPQFQHVDTVIDMIDSDVEMTYLSTKKNNNNTSSKNGNSLSQENIVLEKKSHKKQKKKNFRETTPEIFLSQKSENSVSRKRTPENSKNNKVIKESSAEIFSSQRITSSQKSSSGSLGNLGSELKSQEKQKKNKHKEFSIELLPSKKKQKNISRVENLLASPESPTLLISSERKKKRYREDITNNVDDSTNYSINLVTPKKKSKLSMEEFNSDLPNELDSQKNNVTPKNKTQTENESKQDIPEGFSNDLSIMQQNRLKVKKNFTELGARFLFGETENKNDPTVNDIQRILVDRKSEMENKKKKRKDSVKIDTSVEGMCIELLENNVSDYSGNDTNNNSNVTHSGDNTEVLKKKKQKKLKHHAKPELDILPQNILSKSLDNNTQENLVYKDSLKKKKVKKECDMTETSLGDTSLEIIDNEDEFTIIKRKKSRKKYKGSDNLIDSIFHGNEQNTILERNPKEFIKNKKNKNSAYNSLEESSAEKGEYDDNLKFNKKKISEGVDVAVKNNNCVSDISLELLTTNGFVEKKKKIQNDSLSEFVTDMTKNFNNTVDYVKPEKVKNKHKKSQNLTETSDKSYDGDISTKQENSISDLSLMETSSPKRSTKKKKTMILENQSLPEDKCEFNITKNKENKVQTQLSARENRGNMNRLVKQNDVSSSLDVMEHPNETLVEIIKRKKKKKTKNKENDTQGIRGEDDTSPDILPKLPENLEVLSSDLTEKDKGEFKIKKDKKNNGDNSQNINNISNKIKETEDNNADRDNYSNKSSKIVTSNNDMNRSVKQKDIRSSEILNDVIELPNENLVEFIKRKKKKDKTKNKNNVTQEIDDLQELRGEDDTSDDLLKSSENLDVLSSDVTDKDKNEFKIKKDKKNNGCNITNVKNINDKIKETEDNNADKDNSSNKSSKSDTSNNDMNRSVKKKDISSSEISNDLIEDPNENLVEFIKRKQNKNKENDIQEVDHLQGIKEEDDTSLTDLLKQSENLLADLFKSLDNKVKNTNWSTQKNNSLDDSLSTVFDSIEDDQIKEHNASSDFEQSVTNRVLADDELSTKSSISKLNVKEVYFDEDFELEQKNKNQNIPIKIHKSLYGKIKKNSYDADHSTLSNTGFDDELEPEELDTLRNLSILLPFDEIPPLHRIKRASKVTANEMQLAKELGAKTGAFSKKEDDLIIKNWEQLLKEHNMTIRPHAFFTFKKMGGSKEEKIKFLQYISRGLDDRLPYRVHSRFKILFGNKFKKQGRFSRQEDKEILDYMSTTKSSKPFLDLEASMNRPSNAIQKRYELLTNGKNNSHIIWDLENSERMIKAMLELKKTERVKLLRNATFSEEEWQLLSLILDNIPSKKLQRAWKITVHPRLFMREDAHSIKRKIIELLLEYGYTDVRTVNWEKIAGNFKGITDRKVYDYFQVMLRTVPKDILKDLKSSLEYLLVHYKKRYRRRQLRYKFKNGVLREKRTGKC